jgi:hypothetical protein
MNANEIKRGSVWRRRVQPVTSDGLEEVICCGSEVWNGVELVVLRGVNEPAGGIAVYPTDLTESYDLVADGEEPPANERPLEGWGSL